MLEEVFFGMSADANMGEMISHFSENPSEAPVTGKSFWEAAGVSQEHEVRQFFSSHSVDESDESLLLPTFWGYKSIRAD